MYLFTQCDRDRQVKVRLCSAYLMNVHILHVDAFATLMVMNNSFHLWNKKGRALFAVPGDMQIDLGVLVLAHRDSR